MADERHYFADLRFDVPEKDGPTYKERAHLAPPAAKDSVEERLELHDMRTSPEIVKGGAGLDVQGFTYLQHRSVVQDELLAGRNVEDVYIPELQDLLCQITGAKKALVDSVLFRRKNVGVYVPPKDVVLRGTPLGDALASMPKDGVNNCSINGLRDTIRYCRDDIKAAALPTIKAEDAGETPRYALYSMWRPLKTVRRDPLAICDFRTLDNDTEEIDFASLSNITDDGEFLMHSLLGLPPKRPIKQKWYFLPEQQPDELVVVKFADTGSDTDSSIAPYGLHLSPKLVGQEEEEVRQSVEARVFAFF
ncbi:hypothetical protein PRZ48_002112 [Zasmidium cellare]|uniref:Uncharacterized protein n=1 Tax=Zasmidium cellare TaxID=395010 RepID=A0ABR0F343_ZASCE|nr:hypothetical protein PRZ48_002112 [Zasmidium cellare]